MDYPTPTLNALPDGAVLDQRFKLAAELMKTPGYLRTWREIRDTHPDRPGHQMPSFAAWCLDRVEDLYAEGVARGFITPLPTDADIPPSEMVHIQRAAAAQVHGQVHAQKVAADEQSRVQRASGGFLNG